MDQPLRRPDDHAEIREEVAKLCARFPGEYWRELDAGRAHPPGVALAGAGGGRAGPRAGPPGEARRGRGAERASPAGFVQALTEAGSLGALIPEEFGGAGL